MREILGFEGAAGGGGAADCEACSVVVASHRKDGLEVLDKLVSHNCSVTSLETNREKFEGRDRERKTPVQRL